MKRNLLTSVWAGLMLGAAGIMTAQASSTFITFSVDMATNLANGSFNPPPPAGNGSDTVGVFGTFNGYAPGFQLFQVGSSTVYTNTYNDTADPNGTPVAYRFYINNTGNLEPLSCYDNRAAYTPTNSGASLVLPTSFYGGNGPVISINTKFQVDMSEEIELGHFSKGGPLYIAGSFNGWGGAIGNPMYLVTNDTSILITNFNFGIPGGLVESNVYTRTLAITTCANLGTGSGGLSVTNEIQEWKYVEMPGSSWETPGPFSDDHSGNRFFLDNTSQVLPIVSFSDLPYAPLANVTLNVDMSGVVSYDTNYVRNSVSVWGTFNGWSSGIAMTNNPAAQNTNLFSAVVSMGEGVAQIIQVRYTNSLVAANNPTAAWVYDYVNDSVFNNNARRTITLPVTTTTLNTNVPSFYFLDLALDDYLPKATPVLFSVDMNGAVATNGIAFNPSSDDVYINGMFANGGATPYPQTWYAWSGGVNPVSAPPGYQMIREGATTSYTNTIIIPAGTPVALSYQYGIDPSRFNGGPLEDEAPSGANHFRVVRSTAVNLYTMPADAFTNQPYQEPLFAPGNIYEGMGTLAGGNLTVGTPVAGAIPVSWLGRPGAHLQARPASAGRGQTFGPRMERTGRAV